MISQEKESGIAIMMINNMICLQRVLFFSALLPSFQLGFNELLSGISGQFEILFQRGKQINGRD